MCPEAHYTVKQWYTYNSKFLLDVFNAATKINCAAMTNREPDGVTEGEDQDINRHRRLRMNMELLKYICKFMVDFSSCSDENKV